MNRNTLRYFACGGLSGLGLASLIWLWSFPTAADAFDVASAHPGSISTEPVYQPYFDALAPEQEPAPEREAASNALVTSDTGAAEGETSVPVNANSAPSADDEPVARPVRRRRRQSERFVVPDFETGTLGNARAIAREQRLRIVAEDDLGTLPRRGHAGLHDYVIGQTPPAGEEVAGDTDIELYIEYVDLLEGY